MAGKPQREPSFRFILVTDQGGGGNLNYIQFNIIIIGHPIALEKIGTYGQDLNQLSP